MISLAKNAIIKVRDNSRRKSTHDRAHDVRGTSVLRRPEQSVEVASRANTVTPDYIGRSLGVQWTPAQRGPERKRRRCVIMTAFEIISVIIGILSLLVAFGSLIVAFLAFLDKRNKKK